MTKDEHIAQLEQRVRQLQSAQNQRDNTAKLFYIYSFDVTVTAGATATSSLSIEADSDFILTKLSYFATDNAGTSVTYNTRIVPLVTVQLRDTASGRNLFDSEQPIANLFGSGEIPFIMPLQTTIRANSNVRASFTSLEASNDRRIFLSLIGFKLYRYGS